MSSFNVGEYNANDYAFGVYGNSAPALQVISAPPAASGTYTVTLAYGNITTVDGRTVALNANMPITIGSGAGQETVTPTAVSNTTPSQYGTCTVTAAFSNVHGIGDLVTSGTYGLQEAAAAASALGGLVSLDGKWFANFANHAAGVTEITGQKSVSTKVTVLDKSGVTGAVSYAAAVASNYASTTHVLY